MGIKGRKNSSPGRREGECVRLEVKEREGAWETIRNREERRTWKKG